MNDTNYLGKSLRPHCDLTGNHGEGNHPHLWPNYEFPCLPKYTMIKFIDHMVSEFLPPTRHGELVNYSNSPKYQQYMGYE